MVFASSIRQTVFSIALVVVSVVNIENATAAVINWIDFSGWPNGSLSQTGLTSPDGLTMDATFTNTKNMHTGYPRPLQSTLDDPAWPFASDDISSLVTISTAGTLLTTNFTLDFTNPGGLPAGGSLGIVDLEDLGSSVTFHGYQGGIEVIVNWAVAFYQTAGVNAPPPVWDPLTSTLSGTGTALSTANNFAFLITDVQLDSILMEITTLDGDGVAYAVSRQQVPAIPVEEPFTLLLIFSGLAGLAMQWMPNRVSVKKGTRLDLLR